MAEKKPDPEHLKRFLAQLEGKAPREYPEGRIGPEDEGALTFMIGHDPGRKLVVIDFGKPVDWLAVGPEQAMGLAASLVKHARAVSGKPLTLDLGGD